MDPSIFAGGITIVTLAIVCVSVLCSLGITAAAIALPIYLIRNNQKRSAELMAKGSPGEATILALEDTGMLINNSPRVNVLLDIRMPNRPPYQLKKTVTIPLIRLAQVQVGSVLPVMVDMSDPTNPDKVGLMLK